MQVVYENENSGFAQSVYRGANGRLYCWQADGWHTWEGTLSANTVAGDCGEFINADVFFFSWNKEPICNSSKDVRLQLQGFPEQIKTSIARACSFTDCGAFEFIEKYTYKEPELVAAVAQIAQQYGGQGIPEHIFNGSFADICRKHGQPWTPRHVEITSNGAASVLVGVNR